MNLSRFPIVKIGSLYYIPVKIPKHKIIVLNDYAPEEKVGYFGATFVDASWYDQFLVYDAQEYVTVHIPRLDNGKERTRLDILHELEFVYDYLFGKELVPSADPPEMVTKEPFTSVIAAA
jgi:hypothetical protein